MDSRSARHRATAAAPLARRPAAGFTLVEMLVTIAVIALLVALLVPALGQARQTTRRIVCVSQLRAVLVAAHSYAGDHDGYVPPTSFQGGPLGSQNWPGVYQGTKGMTLTKPPGGVYSGLDPYFGYTPNTPDESKMYWKNNGCPAYAGAQTPVAWIGNHYLLGLITDGPRNRWVQLYDDRVNAAKFALFVECNFNNINSNLYPSPPTNLTRSLHNENNDLWIARHRGQGLSFGYLDGHAAFSVYLADVNEFAPNPYITNYAP